MSDDAFRTFAVDAPYVAQTIKAALLKRKKILADQIAEGYASDFVDYRERFGVLRGLSEAIDICTDMEKKERE